MKEKPLIGQINGSNLIGQISKTSTDVKLRNKIIASILKLISSRLKVCDFDHFRSKFGNFKCFYQDYSKISCSKIEISNIFFNFSSFHSNFLKSPIESNIVKKVNRNSGIVIFPSYSGIVVNSTKINMSTDQSLLLKNTDTPENCQKNH